MDTFNYKMERLDDAIAHIVYYIEHNDNVYEYLWESYPDWDEDMGKEVLVLEHLKKYYWDRYNND